MKHCWVNTDSKYGYKTIFRHRLNNKANKLIISAAPYYNVYFDKKLVSFGPERTTWPYSRIREIEIKEEVKEIEIVVLTYGIPTLDVDFFPSFFGAELYKDNILVADTDDFDAFKSSLYDEVSFKFSFQRGFGEIFDLKNIKETKLEKVEMTGIELIKGIGDTCHYHIQEFTKLNTFELIEQKGEIPGHIYSSNNPIYYQFDPKTRFFDEIQNNGYTATDYILEKEASGLFVFDIESNVEEVNAFIIYDEYLINGEFYYARSTCNDLVVIKASKGKFTVTCSTTVSLKHLRIITKGDIKITPHLIRIENNLTPNIVLTGDEKIDVVLDAARNTFMQNAVDIYTDCPGRERGGWLCDSYFTAFSEKFFTGKNVIEKAFLENIILSDTPELEKGMVPMVYPSQDTLFIPNWGMWFVIELEDYLRRTGDRSLVDLAKDKVMGLVNYFLEFENEYTLLENLRSWVFVEWSQAGTDEYVKGLNFPTNMLYSRMLKSVDKLYNMPEMSAKAALIIENINKMAFNGKVFIDNAIREDGKLKLCEDHTSETCQYYALYLDIKNDDSFVNFCKEELGPLRKEEDYPHIARSNCFIGNYLRFLWLRKIEKETGVSERERIKKECADYFYNMAKYSGTLWEKDIPKASCNHGFASSIAPILLDDNLF